ncbi:hypothetical protein ACTG9Q_24670 [Actinokineospora sp. 24-640]
MRRTDVEHLIRAGLLTATKWARNPRRSKRSGTVVPLYRVGDLNTLAAEQTIGLGRGTDDTEGAQVPLAALPDTPTAR